MIQAALAIAALLAHQHTPHGPEGGPRASVAGLAGFQSVSRQDFGTGQNRLTAVFVFPDRARWQFEDYAAPEQSGQMSLYRQGALVHQLRSGESSAQLDGEQRDVVLLQMELRRAVMLWPDGFTWEPRADGTRSAAVYADTCCRARPIGTLVATLAGARPSRVEVRDANGQELEALAIREWQELHGRTWPRTLAMESENGSFVETVESIETRVHYLEISFVPPDRRSVPSAGTPGPSVISQDLVAVTYASHALPEGIEWSEALARARAWIADAEEAGEEHGLKVEPVPTFELSDQGRPVSCLVRLTGVVQPAPNGYVTVAERPGLLLGLKKLEDFGPPSLARLRQAVPNGVKAGTPYLRIHQGSILPVEVVLPLTPAE